MKRSETVKFPNSVQLFKFCQKVLSFQRNTKVNDQEVGDILEFNPSDCSHWKRGERNIKSVFALAKLAEVMQIETSIVHDVASGAIGLDEAFFEFLEAGSIKDAIAKANEEGPKAIAEARERVEHFVQAVHAQCEFTTPPLYLPEILRFFSFITTQPTDIVDRLTRVLKLKQGQYCIQFRKGDLKPQTRMSMTRDFAKIIFQAERERFPELGPMSPNMAPFEEIMFTSSLLIPKNLILDEMSKLDSRRNMIAELGALFWVPKSLISFQMQDILRSGNRLTLTGKAIVTSDVNISTTTSTQVDTVATY